MPTKNVERGQLPCEKHTVPTFLLQSLSLVQVHPSDSRLAYDVGVGLYKFRGLLVYVARNHTRAPTVNVSNVVHPGHVDGYTTNRWLQAEGHQ